MHTGPLLVEPACTLLCWKEGMKGYTDNGHLNCEKRHLRYKLSQDEADMSIQSPHYCQQLLCPTQFVCIARG